MRSVDGGAHWESLSPDTSGATPFEVAFDGHGLAFALGAPERIWSSRDGLAWQRVTTPPFGATRLDVRDGNLFVRGFDDETRRSDAAGRLVPASKLGFREPPPPPWLDTEPRLEPSGGKLREGSAAIYGDRYYEFDHTQKDRHFKLRFGPIDGPLQSRDLEIGICSTPHLVAFDRFITIACTGPSNGMPRKEPELNGLAETRFYRSEDGGLTFKEEAFVADGKRERLVLAAGRDGALFVSGVCWGENCESHGIYRRQVITNESERRKPCPEAKPWSLSVRRGGPQPRLPTPIPEAARETMPKTSPRVDLALVRSAAFDGNAIAFAVSRDGKRVAALSTGKDEHLTLWASQDAGASFSATPVPDVRFSYVSADALGRRISGSIDEDGTIAFSVSRRLIVRSNNGKLETRAVPAGADTSAVSGRRVLALSFQLDRLWESLDAGVTWTPAQPPPQRCLPLGNDCSNPTYCTAERCFVGDALTRTRWSEPLSTPAPPPSLAAPPQPPNDPLKCTATGAWQRVDGARGAEAEIGEVRFYALARKSALATVSLVRQLRGDAPVQWLDLLPPVANAIEYDLSVTERMGMVAAVRRQRSLVRAGSAGCSWNCPPVDRYLEIAWADVRDGIVHRRGERIAMSAAAEPSLFQVAHDGVYVAYSGFGYVSPIHFFGFSSTFSGCMA